MASGAQRDHYKDHNSSLGLFIFAVHGKMISLNSFPMHVQEKTSDVGCRTLAVCVINAYLLDETTILTLRAFHLLVCKLWA